MLLRSMIASLLSCRSKTLCRLFLVSCAFLTWRLHQEERRLLPDSLAISARRATRWIRSWRCATMDSLFPTRSTPNFLELFGCLFQNPLGIFHILRGCFCFGRCAAGALVRFFSGGEGCEIGRADSGTGIQRA